MAEIIWRSAPVIASTTAFVLRALDQGAQKVQDHAKQLVNRSQPTASSPSGRRRGLDPSAPGEPPKRLEGRLRDSITREQAHVEGSVAVVRVGANTKYARRLELGFFGTDAKGRNIAQAPRPYLRRALAEKRDEILRRLGVKT